MTSRGFIHIGTFAGCLLYLFSQDEWAFDLGVELRLEQDKTKGYIFRSTKQSDDQKLRRAAGQKIQVLSILKNGVHFTTSSLRDASERYQGLQRDYNEKQVSTRHGHTANSLKPS